MNLKYFLKVVFIFPQQKSPYCFSCIIENTTIALYIHPDECRNQRLFQRNKGFNQQQHYFNKRKSQRLTIPKSNQHKNNSPLLNVLSNSSDVLFNTLENKKKLPILGQVDVFRNRAKNTKTELKSHNDVIFDNPNAEIRYRDDNGEKKIKDIIQQNCLYKEPNEFNNNNDHIVQSFPIKSVHMSIKSTEEILIQNDHLLPGLASSEPW